MSEAIIQVEHLSKRYVIGHQRTKGDGLSHAIESAVRHPLRWMRERRQTVAREQEEFWALRDVSFEVKRGEVVGIIGRNGAGKSTLLKILSRITGPSQGRLTIEGRVASLLEVGTGFHHELTGRENIYLNGAILGMTQAEIKRKFDEIVAFSEVEKFLDTPVKRYSSGMYMRLAFAVAAHLEPEILIVDEVLAVGDAAFQKKCLGKMQDVSKGGRTVLFVSHNMGAITTLCRTAIWLQGGRVVRTGVAREIVDECVTSNAESQAQVVELGGFRRAGDFGAKLRIEQLEWITDLPLQHGEKISARIRFRILQNVDEVAIGIGFSTPEGTRLLTYETDFQDNHRPNLKAGTNYCVEFTVPELCLAPGVYLLDVGSRSGDTFGLDYLPGFAQVEIAMGMKTPGYIARQGAGVRLQCEWGWDCSAKEISEVI